VRMMDALSGKHGSKRNAIILHGVKGYLYLSDIPGSSFAKAEGWLARDERGEHPWDVGIQKGYAIHLKDSPLLIDKAKYMTQEGLSGGEQMRILIKYWHRYRSRCALLDTILLARSSPWESPLPEVLVLKPLPQGGIAEARPPKSPFGPHLSNFIAGIRGTEKLNCPAEVGYPSTVVALEILKALEANQHEVAFGKLTVE